MTGGDLNEYIGDIGVYQWLVFIVVFLFNLFNTETYHIIFLGAHMPHWCRVPELEDLPYEIQKNMAIPAQSVNRDGFIDEYSSCEMYSLNYSIYNHSEFYTWNRSLMITNETSIVRCSQWTYDQSQFISTIVKKVRNTNGMLYKNYCGPICLNVRKTMTSSAITVYGQCCKRHVLGKRIISDISVVRS